MCGLGVPEQQQKASAAKSADQGLLGCSVGRQCGVRLQAVHAPVHGRPEGNELEDHLNREEDQEAIVRGVQHVRVLLGPSRPDSEPTLQRGLAMESAAAGRSFTLDPKISAVSWPSYSRHMTTTLRMMQRFEMPDHESLSTTCTMISNSELSARSRGCQKGARCSCKSLKSPWRIAGGTSHQGP